MSYLVTVNKSLLAGILPEASAHRCSEKKVVLFLPVWLKLYMKKDSIAGLFLRILQNYSELLFCRMLKHGYGISSLVLLDISFREIYIMLVKTTRNAQFCL